MTRLPCNIPKMQSGSLLNTGSADSKSTVTQIIRYLFLSTCTNILLSYNSFVKEIRDVHVHTAKLNTWPWNRVILTTLCPTMEQCIEASDLPRHLHNKTIPAGANKHTHMYAVPM